MLSSGEIINLLCRQTGAVSSSSWLPLLSLNRQTPSSIHSLSPLTALAAFALRGRLADRDSHAARSLAFPFQSDCSLFVVVRSGSLLDRPLRLLSMHMAGYFCPTTQREEMEVTGARHSTKT